ncbi:chemerin-like receptor 2 [Leptodactylus fuscus]|uniref:chemerin-like receptor 2 n=1 Tax=Leptodactylus fuscus TaxID=238119 RepID=UPI003F4E5702
MEAPGTERSSGMEAPGTKRSTGMAAPGTERSIGMEAPGTERSTGMESPGTERSSGMEAPGTERSTGMAAPGTDRSTGMEAPGTERSTGMEAPGTERSTGMEAPGTERYTGMEAPGTERSTGMEAPGTERSTESDVTAEFLYIGKLSGEEIEKAKLLRNEKKKQLLKIPRTIENSSSLQNSSERMENSTIDDSDGKQSYRNHIIISYTVVLAVTLLLGITGNGLVIWFGIFRMKKTVSLVWFLNLAVADFIFALFLTLLIAYHVLAYWPFGGFLCKLNIFIYYIIKPIIALQLAVLSVDRCVRVAFPQWCQNHRTKRSALIMVLIIWIFSSPSSLMFSIYSDTYNYYCNFGHPYIMNLHAIIRFVFFFLAPFLVTLCSYIGITLYSLIKKVPLCSRSVTVPLAVSIIFFVCYCPTSGFFLLQEMHAMNYYYVGKFIEISACLLIISSCINPIIYVLAGWEVKDNFCSSFQAMLEKAFAEDDVYVGLSNREDRTVYLNLEGLSH